MPTLIFDGNNACALPPFNAISNKLFYFRVNVFEIVLPLGSRRDPTGALRPGKGRLGLPITDLFPDLMSEFGAAVHKGKQKTVRLDRGVFLPATRPNRYFDSGQVVGAALADLQRGSVHVGIKSFVLSPNDIANLRAGRPVTLTDTDDRI